MASVVSKQVLGLVQLSVLLLSSFTVLGYNEEYAQAPHHMPGHPPVGAPKPHKGHHHHPHPHPPKHPLSPPPANTPTQPPVKPPSPPAKPPTPPPPPPPSKPPTQPPVKPPSRPPVKPPSRPPVKPPSPPPVKPPTPPPSPLIRKRVAVQGVVYCKSCKYTGIDTLLGATPLVGATVRLLCNNTKYPLVEDAETDKNGYFFIMPQKLTTAGAHKCKVFLLSSRLATCNVPTDLHAGRKGAILMPTPKASVPKPTFQLFTVGPFAFEPSKKLPCKY